MGQFGQAQPAHRREDSRFLTGRGRFTDDLDLEGQAHVCLLRSPHAHARLIAVDTAAAASLPGVFAAYTGADVRADGLPPIPCQVEVTSRTGEPMYVPPRDALAVDRVRYVGDPVAMVIADTAAIARDAAEAIEVEYRALPAVVNTARAAARDAPLVWPERGSNLCIHWQNRDPAEVEPLFEAAAFVAEVALVNNRVIANPLEPRCALADYDPAADLSTLYTPSQGVHRMHRVMTRSIFDLDPAKLRIVSPDVGGSFGVRSKVVPELILLVWASRKLGRPLKWLAERVETMMSDNHGRDHVTRARMALDADGRIRALCIETVANMGAYLSETAPLIPTWIGQRTADTVYVVPALYHSVRCVFTNTVPVDSYRGAGRPESAFVMERLMHAAARETGLDAAEIRRRNVVPRSAFPYTNASGLVIDSGDFAGNLDMALERADWRGFERRRAVAAARGMLRGIGIGCYLEGSGGPPAEQAAVRIGADGRVTVKVGTLSQGQGHETVFARITADKLGVPLERVDVVEAGDTTAVAFGNGTTGSRSSQMGGVAIVRACERIIEKSRLIAGNLLQAADARVLFEAGRFRAVDGEASVSLQEVARAAADAERLPDGVEPGLDESYRYERAPGQFNYPNGCHVAEVEVDPETGTVEVVAFTAVDDNGTVLDPVIVHGQAHGGIAQGLGQALLEQAVYDDDTGQLLSASFLDYAMPRAGHLPRLEVQTNEVPCRTNELGVKGAGEGGCCGAPPAIVNAVMDALEAVGVDHIDMPLTSQRVWRTIRDARTGTGIRRSG